MKTFIVSGSVRFWHDCVMAVEAEDEVEAEAKAKKLDYKWFDIDPPDSTKEVELDISDVACE